jgi:hypothetical protein
MALTVYCPDAYISRAHLEPVPTQYRRPTAAAATGPGGGQASSGAFADQVALELGQGGKDVEDELATGSGGVDRLLEAAEPDATAGQAGEGIDQVPQGAAKAIEFPDDQGVARAQLVQDLLEDRAVAAGAAAGGLGEHPVAAGRHEGVDLKLELLVGSGDAGVTEQMSHAADRLTTLRHRWLCDVDFGHGFWTPFGVLVAGEWRLSQKRARSQGVVASLPH